jgi:hypothetical protein
MNRILTNLKKIGCTISETKSQFCMPKFRVIKFVCNALGRHPNISKIIKIVKWFFPNNIIEAKTFISVGMS